ncbi:hypothetical protein [Saccharothrix texasensis]|uniref:Uncharacterized protein n=1 Tax=Saccharothrix texasensis TaxID=103734 RepID=A0A3N1HE51_9PSEU|nr:hypothetical protein [Saccharothrix texasensis]ROP40785.1 hypothetical protein EDD40_6203 [Saccharothrix texasensis]
MTAILFALAVVALVVYGLERNHRRQPHLGSRLAGGTDTEDRDLPRVTADLRAVTARSTARHRGAAPRRPVGAVRSIHPARSA